MITPPNSIESQYKIGSIRRIGRCVQRWVHHASKSRVTSLSTDVSAAPAPTVHVSLHLPSPPSHLLHALSLLYISVHPIFPISQHSCSHLVFFLPPNFFYSQHPVSIFSTVSLPLLLISHTQHPLRSPSPDQWRPRTRNSLRRSRTLSPARSISWTPPLNPPPKTTNQLTSFWYAFITFEIISIWKILTQIHDFGTG